MLDFEDPVIWVCIGLIIMYIIVMIRAVISDKRSKERAAENGGVDPVREAAYQKTHEIRAEYRENVSVRSATVSSLKRRSCMRPPITYPRKP